MEGIVRQLYKKQFYVIETIRLKGEKMMKEDKLKEIDTSRLKIDYFGIIIKSNTKY